MEASVSNLSNEKLLAYSVSLDKFQKVTEALAGSAEKAAKALRWVHEEFGDWAAVTLNAGESAGKAATSYAANVIGSGVGSFIGTKLGVGKPVIQAAAKSPGLFKSGLQLAGQALKSPLVIFGAKLAAAGATGYVGGNLLAHGVNSLSEWWNADKNRKMKEDQQERLRRAKAELDRRAAENGSSKDNPPELDFSNDAPLSNKPEVSQSKPQPKTEEYLGSILGLLEKLTNEIESDAFYRKANQKLANNMTE